MDNAAWYAWDDMTPWRFAILIGVVLVAWIIIKLNDRYGFLNFHGQIHDETNGKTYDFQYDSLGRELRGRTWQSRRQS